MKTTNATLEQSTRHGTLLLIAELRAATSASRAGQPQFLKQANPSDTFILEFYQSTLYYKFFLNFREPIVFFLNHLKIPDA